MRIVHEHINYEISSTIGKFFDSKEFFHWHENFEICRVFNGACSFLVDGVVYDASEGDIVIINERSVHDFLVDSPDVVIELVQFPLKMLLNSGVSIKPLKTVITKEEILSVDGLDKKIDFIFSSILSEGAVRDMHENPYLQNITASLYFVLMRSFSDEHREKNNLKERRDFFTIVKYINDHITEDITIQSVAKELFISRGKVSMVFEKYSGMGINHYINLQRVTNVNRLLNEGLSITEAALECGFQNMRTFNNIYKKIMEVTPSEYCKSFSVNV